MSLPTKQRNASARASAEEVVQQYPEAARATRTPAATDPPSNGAYRWTVVAAVLPEADTAAAAQTMTTAATSRSVLTADLLAGCTLGR
jgi:hypothetical protein